MAASRPLFRCSDRYMRFSFRAHALRTRAELQYQSGLQDIRRRWSGSGALVKPSLELVAIPRPFTEFHLLNRTRRGDDAALESRVRNRAGGHFVTFDDVHYWDIPSRERDALFKRIPEQWRQEYEPPRFLCVPTPPIVAYHASELMAPEGSATQAIHFHILVSEEAFLTLFCFLLAARDEIRCKTKCIDPRLYLADTEGSYGRLFYLPEALRTVIRNLGLGDAVQDTPFSGRDAQRALDAVADVDWSKAPTDGFVFYNYSEGRFLRVPGCEWPYTHPKPAPVAVQRDPYQPRAPLTAIPTPYPDPYAVRSQPVMSDPYAEPAAVSTREVRAVRSDGPTERDPYAVLYATPTRAPAPPVSQSYRPEAAATEDYGSNWRRVAEPASPHYGPPGPAYAPPESEEQRPFVALQRACADIGKTAPRTVADALRLAVLWARDSTRVSRVEQRAQAVLDGLQETEAVVLERVRGAEGAVRGLLELTHRTAEDYRVSEMEPPTKRPRTG